MILPEDYQTCLAGQWQSSLSSIQAIVWYADILGFYRKIFPFPKGTAEVRPEGWWKQGEVNG